LKVTIFLALELPKVYHMEVARIYIFFVFGRKSKNDSVNKGKIVDWSNEAKIGGWSS